MKAREEKKKAAEENLHEIKKSANQKPNLKSSVVFFRIATYLFNSFKR